MNILLRKPKGRDRPSDGEELPPLENGERLDQKTFHERYEAMPEGTRAELIGGVVYMSSPVKRRHGKHSLKLLQCIGTYEDATPGVEAFDNTTAILDDESEPQPDGALLIAPSKGGQTRSVDDYIVGAPEWLGEIAVSSQSIDLHTKKKDYEDAGVKEYLVVALRQRKVYYFISRGGRFEELSPGSDGVYRSEVFPGLWIDGEALLAADGKKLSAVLQLGLASPEHAAFVERLAKP